VLSAAFSTDSAGEKLDSLVRVSCLVHIFYVEKTFQDLSNREVC